MKKYHNIKLSLLFIVILAIISNSNCEKFVKIKEMLQKAKEQFQTELKHFENQEELEKSEILKEILAKPLLNSNYHSTITEYEGG
jgi:hypothetical protein